MLLCLAPLPNLQLTLPQALTAIILAEGQRPASKWAPYLALLPRELDSLVFWSEAELKELQASTVVHKIGRTAAEDLFSRHIAPLKLENGNVEMCHRVASIIMAYAFDIPERASQDGPETTDEGDELISDDGEDEKTILSMIPLADMLVSHLGKCFTCIILGTFLRQFQGTFSRL